MRTPRHTHTPRYHTHLRARVSKDTDRRHTHEFPDADAGPQGFYHQTSGAACASATLLLNEAPRWLLLDVWEGTGEEGRGGGGFQWSWGIVCTSGCCRSLRRMKATSRIWDLKDSKESQTPHWGTLRSFWSHFQRVTCNCLIGSRNHMGNR